MKTIELAKSKLTVVELFVAFATDKNGFYICAKNCGGFIQGGDRCSCNQRTHFLSLSDRSFAPAFRDTEPLAPRSWRRHH
jgi:hypothetical protein